MGIQAKVGDVFLIPLDGQCWACGQLINSWNDELYIAVFNQKARAEKPDLHLLIEQQPVFLALTLDAKLWHGDWPIIGNLQENLAGFPEPAFKVRQSGTVHIESRDRTVSRHASPSEAAILRYRSVSSPALIESAARAHFGFSEWSPHYDDLLADYAHQSARLLNI